MDLWTILFLFLSLISTSNAQDDFDYDGNTSRVVQTIECDQIVAKGQKGRTVNLERCEYGQGGIGYDPKNPSYVYYQNDELYNGYIEQLDDGSYTTIEGDDFTSVTDASLPDKFKCDGKNGNETQCQVCNCYHESRGQSYPEKVMIARVVFSRAKNPIFANSVCGVVHERRGSREVAQFSWIRRSEDNCLNSSCNPDDLNDPGYKVNSYLGHNTGHKTSLDRKAFGECVTAVKEATKTRKRYFASYYFTGPKPGWAKQCEENYPSSSNRISTRRIAHTFYSVCEDRERKFGQMLSSPRPPKRPKMSVPKAIPGVS